MEFSSNMNIERSEDQCRYDGIVIYNDIEMTSEQGCRICSAPIPPSITSTGNVMVVRFYSDSSVQYAGFSATYTSVSPVTHVEELPCYGEY